MSVLKSIESSLDQLLVRNAPYQLPVQFVKWAGEYAWLLALISVVLGILGLLGLLMALGLSSTTLGAESLPDEVALAWVSTASLGIQVLLTALAIAPLKNKHKNGWNLIFYSQMVAVVTGILTALQYDDAVTGMVRFFASIAWVAIGLYFLFQVRSQFGYKA